MINFKPNIVKALKRVLENVTEEYPDTFERLPCITYTEELNVPYSICSNGERISTLEYRIDIWSNTSTSELKQQINEQITQLGFTRSFCQDIKDPSGLKHTVLRFEGALDLDNNRIYKNK